MQGTPSPKAIAFVTHKDAIDKYVFYKPTEFAEGHRDIVTLNNDKLRIVPYLHQHSNGQPVITYKVGAYKALSHVFHKRKLSLDELILLLYGMVHTMVNGRKCGLYENSFALDPDYIYLTHDSIQPFLIYIPSQLKLNLNEQLILFLDWLKDHVDTAEEGTAKLVQVCRESLADGYELSAIVGIVVQAANTKVIERPDQKPVTANEPATPAETEPKTPAKVADKPSAEPTPKTNTPPKTKPAPAPKAPSKKQGIFSKFFGGEAKQVTTANFDDFMPTIDDRTMIDFTIYEDGEADDRPTIYELDNGSRVAQHHINRDTYTLGRDPECDGVFAKPTDKGVSRVHAVLMNSGSQWYISDKGSSGGTYVNDERVLPGENKPLQNGDTFRLYKKAFLFELEQ